MPTGESLERGSFGQTSFKVARSIWKEFLRRPFISQQPLPSSVVSIMWVLTYVPIKEGISFWRPICGLVLRGFERQVSTTERSSVP